MSLVRSQYGFTLVEVALALGIFAFAAIGIVGLIPTALSGARYSLDQATATQLANRLQEEMTGRNWSQLAPGSQVRYFDDNGTSTANTTRAVYRADVDISASDSENLRCVQIEVQRYPGTAASWFFSFYVFNQGE